MIEPRGDTFNFIVDKHYAWLQSMGYSNWPTDNGSVLAQLMLVVSEVGEAANECRKGDSPSLQFGHELADIILRVMGIARRLDIDLATEVFRKMAINEINGTKGRSI